MRADINLKIYEALEDMVKMNENVGFEFIQLSIVKQPEAEVQMQNLGTEGRNCKTEISPAIGLENVEMQENVSSRSSDHGDWFEGNLSKKSSNQMW